VPDAHEGVVQHFLGQLAAPDDAQRHAEQHRRRGLVHAPEGVGRALIARGGAQQLSPDGVIVEHFAASPSDDTVEAVVWMPGGAPAL
jgi:hypothetical protein